jgi:uncharacterized protein (DUF924 family)
MTTPSEVLEFWFGDPPQTANGAIDMLMRLSPVIDEEIRQRFIKTIEAAKKGDLDTWTDTHDGTRALVLVLDQLPRHAYRGQAKQYEGDAKALELAMAADREGWLSQLPFLERTFMILPFSHSEKLEHQKRAMELSDENAKDAPAWCGELAKIGPSQSRKYYDIIQRFGRFPHRNEMLGRKSTPEEREWLDGGGAERMPPELIKKLIAERS